jgi:hypothetical protein
MQSGLIASMLRLLQKWQPQSPAWHKAIYRIQRALAPAFTNIVLILGHRSYFGKDGDRLVILLVGGTKKRQQNDIRHAQELWTDYRRRSKKEK